MKDSPPPTKRRRYDAAFRAEALRLASESRSTQAAARALNIDPKRIYKWQKEALTPVAAARGAELDPATAAELRQLRAANRRLAQELDILKKAIAIFSQTPDQWAATASSPLSAAITRAPALPNAGHASQRLLRLADRAAADGGEPENAGLGNGTGQETYSRIRNS